nr:hypothetical protein L321_21627 [Pseudomonas plecoglossicida NB2011]
MAKVKMPIEIDNTDAWTSLHTAQVFGQAHEACVGDFMPATQAQGQVPLLQQQRDTLGVGPLRAFEVSALAGDIAAVIDRPLTAPGQVGQRLAQGRRTEACARAALVAAYAFIGA